MNKRYYVIATVWSEEHKKQIRVIAGEFDSHMNATIFRDAYNKNYSADSVIVDDFVIANTNIMSA